VVEGKLVGEGEVNAAGEREGMGTMVHASGDMYAGRWKAGLQEGEGTSYFATGSKYVGEWKAGKQEGEGVRWSVDHKAAWRCATAARSRGISLEEAARIAAAVGLPVP
jgi:hypothetical protein